MSPVLRPLVCVVEGRSTMNHSASSSRGSHADTCELDRMHKNAATVESSSPRQHISS